MNLESMNSVREAGFLSRLRREVEYEIDNYVYEVPDDAIGKPTAEAAIAEGLAQMRSSLVEPYWAEVQIRDTFEQIGMSVVARHRCAVVADDRKGFLLTFDLAEGSFLLAQRGETGLITFGVRGDAVGCFLAR
jgi:hypothetical protein